MTTLTETKASKKLKEILSEITDSHYPVKIKGKNGTAVLVSESDWNSIEETLYLLSIPGMRESIIEGINTPIEKCTKKLKW